MEVAAFLKRQEGRRREIRQWVADHAANNGMLEGAAAAPLRAFPLHIVELHRTGMAWLHSTADLIAEEDLRRARELRDSQQSRLKKVGDELVCAVSLYAVFAPYSLSRDEYERGMSQINHVEESLRTMLRKRHEHPQRLFDNLESMYAEAADASKGPELQRLTSARYLWGCDQLDRMTTLWD